MLKPVIAAAAVLAIAGSSLVYAQQRFGDYGDLGRPRAEFRHRLSADDMIAFADARIAALKAGLELTPDQAKNWPAFEQALHDLAQLRIQRIQAWQAGDQRQLTPLDRLARRADNMAKASAALKHVAETGAPLYQSLSDAQKARFVMLARVLRPHMRRRAFLGRPWREGYGYGYGRSMGRDGRLGQDDRGQGDDDQAWRL